MTRRTINDVKAARLATMTAAERAEFEETYGAARLALDCGEQVRDASIMEVDDLREVASGDLHRENHSGEHLD